MSGDLASQISQSDSTRMFNVLGSLGVTAAELTRFNSALEPSQTRLNVANALKYGLKTVEDGPYTNNHLIDCNPRPSCPKGLMHWEVATHQRFGKVHWHPNRVGLATYDGQEMYRLSAIAYNTDEIATTNKRLKALPANILFYYLSKPWLISAEWQEYNVYFPGTTFRFTGPKDTPGSFNGDECVFGIRWSRGRISHQYEWQLCIRKTNHPGQNDVIAILLDTKK